MKRLEEIGRAATPDGGELVLLRRGEEFLLRIDGYDLMGSRSHGTEEALAVLALEALEEGERRPAPRVLVGGLGMGFTVRAALDALGDRPRARVVVAELFPEVVAWNRGPLAHLAGRPLDDPRVEIETRDVVDLVADAASGRSERFDAVLLDVDNGPDALVLDANRRLYDRRGLDRLHRALAPGGVLALWSTADDPSFPDRLRRHGFRASRRRVAGGPGGKGERFVVFLGCRTDR